jgi:TolB-like protein
MPVQHRIILMLVMMTTVLMLNACGSAKIAVRLNSTPEGADVYFSPTGNNFGESLGKTLFTTREYDFNKKENWVGSYQFKKDRFKTETKPLGFPPKRPKDGIIEISAELQPLTSISLNVTSNPSGATIYFTEEGGTFKKLGVASPKLSESKEENDSDQPVSWPKGSYKAELKGYKTKVVSVEQTGSNREVQFELEPLPKAPVLPKITYPDVKTSIPQPTVDVFPPVEIPSDAPLVILPFSDKSGTDASITATDKLIYRLQRKGFFVIEREIVDKAKNDVLTAHPERKTGADVDMAKDMSGQLNSRHFLFGTIMDFSEELESISIQPVIAEADKLSYQKDYDEYVGYFESEKLTPPQAVKSFSEIEQENAAKVKIQKVKIAKVSISAKLVDSRNGRTLWKGIVSITDKDLNNALDKAINAIADNMASHEEKKTLLK